MGLTNLLFQAAAVGGGAYIVGTAPLWFSSIASGRKLKVTSTYGKGLLVGAALTIIIPEGVSTLYASSASAHKSHGRSNSNSSSLAPSSFTAAQTVVTRDVNLAVRSIDALQLEAFPRSADTLPVRTGQRRDDDDDDDDDDDKDDDDDDDEAGDLSQAIGLSLITGFVLMLLIEQWTHAHESPSSSGPSASSSSSGPRGPTQPTPSRQQSTIPLLPERDRADWHRLQRRPSLGALTDEVDEEANISGDVTPQLSPRASAEEGATAGSGSWQWRDTLAQHPKSASAVFALVVHSLADGIALGASARSGDGDLGIVVFLAIMIHKIPASVGLCTTLQADGLPRALVRWGVAAFAAAAPAGAFLTYALVNLVGRVLNENALQYWTGIALTFSGGTFLYVATVIQDINAPAPSHPDDDGTTELSKASRLAILIAGMLTPIMLATLVHDD